MLRRRSKRSSCGFLDVFADARANLDDGLVELSLDALLKPQLALRQHLGRDVGTQIPGIRIDGLVLLFDAKGEARSHCGLRSYDVAFARFRSLWLRVITQRTSLQLPFFAVFFAAAFFGVALLTEAGTSFLIGSLGAVVFFSAPPRG